MRLFVFEFITGGGCLSGQAPPSGSLLNEGRAMLEAVVADLAVARDVEVTCLRDRRLAPWHPAGGVARDVATVDQLSKQFDRLAAESAATLVIAPEFDGRLLHYCQRVLNAGGQLLGPPPDVVKLAADKHATAAHLSSAGVPVPAGVATVAGEPLPDVPSLYPAIWKPRFGAGSQEIRYLSEPPCHFMPNQWGRLETYCAGISASVALLCGPRGFFPLPACAQHLSDDGQFRYLGGGMPLKAELALRAERLAKRAIATLPEARGYLGVDLVLGEAPDGSQDVVVEINPRLTTSYVGLRAAARHNLAEAMLDACLGKVPRLAFDPYPLRFDATGQVWWQ